MIRYNKLTNIWIPACWSKRWAVNTIQYANIEQSVLSVILSWFNKYIQKCISGNWHVLVDQNPKMSCLPLWRAGLLALNRDGSLAVECMNLLPHTWSIDNMQLKIISACMKEYYAKTLYTMLYNVKISMGANADLIWDKDWIKLISFNPPL